MATYSAAQRTSNVTISNTTWTIISPASNSPRLFEVQLSINAATASVFGFGRPAAVGITPTTPVTFMTEEAASGPAGVTTCALAWATLPTSPTNFLRRVSLPATIGSGIIWTFPRGLGIPISQNVVIFNVTATSVADVSAVVDE